MHDACKNARMRPPAPSSASRAAPGRTAAAWVRAALWLLASVAGAAWIARAELAQMREAFDTDARIAHRLLSQQVVQHDAILATLALLQPAGDAAGSAAPEQRLSALYPHILGVVRREASQPWPDDALQSAEAASSQARRPVLADADFARERYRVVLAATPVSYALIVQARRMVPWSEWPLRADGPVRVALEHAGQQLVLQEGAPATGGWTFDFRKHLAAESQPFDVVLSRSVGWRELPWGAMLLWAAVAALLLAAQWMWQRQRTARRRAEDLLRLGQVARLNTLGELAAGMAHELNQPLTAVLANTQAAARLLADDPPDLETARGAMTQAAEQARRAAGVVARLRRAVERPGATAQTQSVDLAHSARDTLHLLEPECTRRGVVPSIEATGAVNVRADPVALEQIVHNLVMNALQALEQVDAGRRRLSLRVSRDSNAGRLEVIDSGPGIAPELLPRIFEPFVTTRADGLGLGLSLCETLATGLGGSLVAGAATGGGAVFTLTLPLADGDDA